MRNAPDDWDDEYIEDKEPCEECRCNKDEKEYMHGLFGELVNVLYHNEGVSLFKLHDLIDEIGSYLGNRNIPDHLPPVVRMNQLGRELHNIPSSSIKK